MVEATHISNGPRERLLSVGQNALSDEELIALLLGTGRRGEPVTLLSTRLLYQTGGLSGLARMGVGALSQQPGIGFGKAARLIAAFELGSRLLASPMSAQQPICSSHDIDAALRPRLAHAEREYFIAIPTDARNRPLGELKIGIGGLDHCSVQPSDVYRLLIREAASGVIFVHNHPSGDPSPSQADRLLTERLCQAGELLGIRVLDHVIIAKQGFFSFRDIGFHLDSSQ